MTAPHGLSDFLSRFGHELRTPMNAILGYAQLLESASTHPVSAERRGQWARQILCAGQHVLQLIDEMQVLSHAGSRTFDLHATVRDALAMVGWMAQQRQITLSVVVPEDVAPVAGDPLKVKQILVNLLSNAVKYNRTGGRIELHAHSTPDRGVRITVRDTGLGMNGAQRAALFQPFNRLGREACSIEGSGIGLAISKQLAETMGGRLTAYSVDGVGSLFCLRLPAQRSTSRAIACDHPAGSCPSTMHE
jgi:signal transduction histidine kinase